MTEIVDKRTKYIYSMTGIGRDMMYALYANFLLVFLTDGIGVSNTTLISVGVIIAIARVWDAINDPIMGMIIDNTKSRHGKFKPWILFGALLSAIFFYLLFQDFGLSGTAFLVVFGLLYVLSGMAFTMNDIAYWSLYPSLTSNPQERESIGSLARIFASLGMFIVIAAVPIVYQNMFGTPRNAFSIIALVVCLVYVLSQIILFIFLKQPRNKLTDVRQEKTTLKAMFNIIRKNDQLVVIIIAILLFNIGYFVTTALGIYFFNYDFNKYGGGEFTMFMGVLAVSQLTALMIFPALMKKISRKKLFTIAILMIATGYALFISAGYVLPMNMLVIGFAGLILFSGQGFIQVLVLVMLADTIEYGHWKLGTRNESVVFAINPFVVKMATAFQTIIVSVTLAVSGLNNQVINPLTHYIDTIQHLPQEQRTTLIRAFIDANTTTGMLLILRLSMIVLPLLLILCSYLVYYYKFKIDDKFYKQITSDLAAKVAPSE
ncbi:MAG: MFS transporter [Acholeplasmataceae bacterium]|nr:MAG: MFS transporter [Acholeplasmataceae bacterium]